MEVMEALPKYSKQQVNNAGYIITGKKEANSEQQVEALKIIEDFRILHFKPTLGIRSFVTGRLSKIGLLDNKNIIVQRLKKMSTLIDKIGKRKDKRSSIVVSWKITNFGKKLSKFFLQIQDIL